MCKVPATLLHARADRVSLSCAYMYYLMYDVYVYIYVYLHAGVRVVQWSVTCS
jgi:hypothetical protein